MDRQSGTLRVYFGDRGFGFIESDQLGDSVFVHVAPNVRYWGVKRT